MKDDFEHTPVFFIPTDRQMTAESSTAPKTPHSNPSSATEQNHNHSHPNNAQQQPPARSNNNNNSGKPKTANSKLSTATVSRVQGGGSVMFFSSVMKGRGSYAATEAEAIRQLAKNGVIGGPSYQYRRHQTRARELENQNQSDAELYAQSVRSQSAADANRLWREKQDLQKKSAMGSSLFGDVDSLFGSIDGEKPPPPDYEDDRSDSSERDEHSSETPLSASHAANVESSSWTHTEQSPQDEPHSSSGILHTSTATTTTVHVVEGMNNNKRQREEEDNEEVDSRLVAPVHASAVEADVKPLKKKRNLLSKFSE